MPMFVPRCGCRVPTVLIVRSSSAAGFRCLSRGRGLESQVAAMEDFCLGRGLALSRWVREIGGGINLARPKFTALMDDVADSRISTLAVAHKDRLARSGSTTWSTSQPARDARF